MLNLMLILQLQCCCIGTNPKYITYNMLSSAFFSKSNLAAKIQMCESNVSKLRNIHLSRYILIV